MKRLLTFLIISSLIMSGCASKNLNLDSLVNKDSEEQTNEVKEQEEPSTDLTIVLKNPDGVELHTTKLRQIDNHFKIEASYIHGPRKDEMHTQEFKTAYTWFNHTVIPQSYSAVDAFTDLSIDVNYAAMGLMFAAMNFVGNEDMERWDAEGRAVYLLRYVYPQIDSYREFGTDIKAEYTLEKGEEYSVWNFTFSEFDVPKAIITLTTPKEFNLNPMRYRAPKFEENENKIILNRGNEKILEKTVKSTGTEFIVDLQEPVSLKVEDALNQALTPGLDLSLGERLIHLVVTPGRSTKDIYANTRSELILSTVNDLMKAIGQPFDLNKVFVSEYKGTISGDKVTFKYPIVDKVTKEPVLELVVENSDNYSYKYESFNFEAKYEKGEEPDDLLD